MLELKDFIADGWYEIEQDETHKWVWSKKDSSIKFDNNENGYILEFFSDKNNIILEIFNEKQILGKYYLNEGIKTILIPQNIKKIKLKVSKTFCSDTKRELGICLNKITEYQDFSKNSGKPINIELELTTSCNINPSCIMCDQRVNGKYKRLEVSDKLIDRVKPYLRNAEIVSLHGIGEPLLTKKLPEVLGLLKKDCKSTFNTNGILLTKEMSQMLIEKGLKEINISLDASKEETYLKIRRNKNFNKIIENIKNLTLLKKQSNSKTPMIMINMTLMNENLGDLESFILLAKEVGAEVVCIRLLRPLDKYYVIREKDFIFDYKKQMINTKSRRFKDIIKSSAKMAKKLGLGLWTEHKEINELIWHNKLPENKDKIFYKIFSPICKKPWENIMISANGDSRFCCFMRQRPFKTNIIGNLEDDSLEKIWDSNFPRLIRKEFLEQKMPYECLLCPIFALEVKKAKIAIFHDYFRILGGAEKLVLTLAKHLKADVITSEVDPTCIEKSDFKDVNIIPLGKLSEFSNFLPQTSKERFSSCDYKENYDFFIFSGNFSIYAAKKHKPNIWYCHTPLRGLYDLRCKK